MIILIVKIFFVQFLALNKHAFSLAHAHWQCDQTFSLSLPRPLFGATSPYQVHLCLETCCRIPVGPECLLFLLPSHVCIVCVICTLEPPRERSTVIPRALEGPVTPQFNSTTAGLPGITIPPSLDLSAHSPGGSALLGHAPVTIMKITAYVAEWLPLTGFLEGPGVYHYLQFPGNNIDSVPLGQILRSLKHSWFSKLYI